MERKFRLIGVIVILAVFSLFVLGLLVVFVAGIVNPKGAKALELRTADAKAVGEIDLKDVPHSTFGYLKSTLAPLPVRVEECKGVGVNYSNCKKATWGHGLVSAIFVTGEGFWGAKDIADDRPVAGIRISSEFQGKLCGQSIQRTLERSVACDVGVEIAKDSTGRFVYEGLHRDPHRPPPDNLIY